MRVERDEKRSLLSTALRRDWTPGLCSVVMPAYNVEPFIRKSIESALAQTYGEVEVIVVNDGSTDGTSGAVDAYRDSIVYLEQPHRGVAAARNVGLRAARGGFLAFLDGDDYVEERAIQRCVDLLAARPEVGFVTTDAYLEKGEAHSETLYQRRESKFGRDDAFPDSNQLAAMVRANFTSIGVVVRRRLFESHGLFDERFSRCSDHDLWIRFLAGGEAIALVREPLLHIRYRPGSLRADHTGAYGARLSVLEKHASTVCRYPRGMGRECWQLAKRALAAGDRRIARQLLLAAARDRDLRPTARFKSLARALVPDGLAVAA